MQQRGFAMLIDDTSRRIIEILQRDGRCPNTVIGRALGLSEASVRARIHALTSAGILQIVGLTDPGNMGFGVMAMIGLQANNDLNRIAELVSTWRETTYVVISAGSYDLLIELRVQGQQRPPPPRRAAARSRWGAHDRDVHLHLPPQAQLRLGRTRRLRDTSATAWFCRRIVRGLTSQRRRATASIRSAARVTPSRAWICVEISVSRDLRVSSFTSRSIAECSSSFEHE